MAMIRLITKASSFYAWSVGDIMEEVIIYMYLYVKYVCTWSMTGNLTDLSWTLCQQYLAIQRLSNGKWEAILAGSEKLYYCNHSSIQQLLLFNFRNQFNIIFDFYRV